MEIKNTGRGGKRDGAGRKPNAIKRLESVQASGILSAAEEKRLWNSFINHSDPNIGLKAFLAWNDRVYGKPKQSLEHTGKDGEPIQSKLTIEFI